MQYLGPVILEGYFSNKKFIYMYTVYTIPVILNGLFIKLVEQAMD